MCLPATVAPAARAVDPYVVDVQECDRNGGQATVPAGVPDQRAELRLRDGDVRPDAGLPAQAGDVARRPDRDGTLTIVDVTDQWSEPEQIGDGPARGWVTRLPNIELDPLAPGEVVRAGSLTEFSGPIQIVFAPVGLIGFGPFHVPAGDFFLQGCEITAV